MTKAEDERSHLYVTGSMRRGSSPPGLPLSVGICSQLMCISQR
jgi:hypothetical protein